MNPDKGPDKQTTPEGEAKSRRPAKTRLHNRTASYNKISAAIRPGINRSKSTDGVLRVKRNNKSFTKLANLQPLTKTLSNQSLKSSKSNGSLKNLGIIHSGGLTLTQKQGKAILKLNDDEDYEDVDEEEEPTSVPRPASNPVIESTSTLESLNVPLQQVFQQALDNPQYVDHRPLQNQYAVTNEKTPKYSSDTPDYGSEAPNASLTAENLPVSTTNNHQNSNSNQKTTTSHSESVVQHPHKNGTQETQSIEEESSEMTHELSKESKSVYALPEPSNTVHESQNSLSSDLYGGSLLLSQSTGLVKKVNPNDHMFESSSSTDGAISFQANPVNADASIAEPVVVNKNAIKENSYQPNQTIFNNLQRTNSEYVNTKKKLQRQQENKRFPNQPLNLNGANNFSNFLETRNSSLNDSHDNRTQQRLWLQRENSLMDINAEAQLSNLSSLSLNNLMFSHNYQNSNTNLNQMSVPSTPGGISFNMGQLGQLTPMTETSDSSRSSTNIHGLLAQVQGTQNPIQSRIEYERLNREYLNVRRYLNPIGESLNRFKANTIKIDKKASSASDSTNKSGNTFQEFSPEFREKEQEVTVALNRIWQDALIQTSSMKSRSQSSVNSTNSHHNQHHSTQIPMGKPQIQRLPSRGQQLQQKQQQQHQQQLPMRVSQPPTTRAVKLQAQAHAQAQQLAFRQT